MPTEKYAKLAHDYDIRWSFYNQATIKHTLAPLKVSEGMSVLDVGCGTGNMLKAIATTHPAVQLSGLEPTEEMLNVARKKLGPDIILKQGFAENLPFEDQSFDIILSNSMFHYIQQPERFLEEAARVLRPGGQIIITDWCHDFFTSKLNNLMLRLNKDRYTRIYKIRELTGMIEQQNFSLVTADRYKINWFWGLMTIEATRQCTH